MIRTVAVVQARMGSSRLTGKVMRRLGATSVLGQVIRRARACPLVDEVVVATTEHSRDDPIVAESRRHGASVVRGSEDDVLARYQLAARTARADAVVRITSDCPLFDPALLERMLRRFAEHEASGRHVDYLSNTLVRTYPRGLDAEILTMATLDRAHREARQPYEREHVTPYVYRHPELFSVESFVGEVDDSRHRWTLDTEDDFALLDAIYTALERDAVIFPTQAVLDLLAGRPDLVRLNAHVEQKPVEG